ncbi:MAG: hypothetical protein ACRYG2_36320 [Janthinobacterium lividum]
MTRYSILTSDDPRKQQLVWLLLQSIHSSQIYSSRRRVRQGLGPRDWATAEPSVIVRCQSAADVHAAVRAATCTHVPVSVLEDWNGSADCAGQAGGLMIDLPLAPDANGSLRLPRSMRPRSGLKPISRASAGVGRCLRQALAYAVRAPEPAVGASAVVAA